MGEAGMVLCRLMSGSATRFRDRLRIFRAMPEIGEAHVPNLISRKAEGL
jgi:hypothetical protein